MCINIMVIWALPDDQNERQKQSLYTLQLMTCEKVFKETGVQFKTLLIIQQLVKPSLAAITQSNHFLYNVIIE